MWHEGAAKEYRGTPWEKEFAEHEAAILAAQAKGDVKEELSLRQAWRHERFARGLEAYIKEVEAPTSRLAAVFEKCRKLLCTVSAGKSGEGNLAGSTTIKATSTASAEPAKPPGTVSESAGSQGADLTGKPKAELACRVQALLRARG